jgi:uncharacterized protein
MKLLPCISSPQHVNSIQAYTADSITINHQVWRTSVLLSAQDKPRNWQCDQFENLTLEHFEELARLNSELVLLGTGLVPDPGFRLRRLNPVFLQPLIAKNIGIETMDTAAACRTYNILVAEGRRVAAGLILKNNPFSILKDNF